jgi:hypothetical protein
MPKGEAPGFEPGVWRFESSRVGFSGSRSSVGGSVRSTRGRSMVRVHPGSLRRRAGAEGPGGRHACAQLRCSSEEERRLHKPDGRGFESRHRDFRSDLATDCPVAQRPERLFHTQCAAGSTPAGATWGTTASETRQAVAQPEERCRAKAADGGSTPPGLVAPSPSGIQALGGTHREAPRQRGRFVRVALRKTPMPVESTRTNRTPCLTQTAAS